VTDGTPSLEDKIAHLRSVGLYEIMFRNAGVGCLFYTGPYDDEGYPPSLWKQHLSVERYYPSFTAAIDAEYERLKDATWPLQKGD
jgi:hypothetical protein